MEQGLKRLRLNFSLQHWTSPEAFESERESERGADDVVGVAFAAEIHIVEHRSVPAVAKLRAYAGSAEDAVAIRGAGFVVERRAAAAFKRGADVARVV